MVEGDERRPDSDHRALVVVLVDGFDRLPAEGSGAGIEGGCVTRFTGAIVPDPPSVSEDFGVV